MTNAVLLGESHAGHTALNLVQRADISFLKVFVMERRTNVLLVTADEDLSILIITTLQSEGHNAMAIYSGVRARAVLRAGYRADILVLDASTNHAPHLLFLPELIERVGSNNACVLSEAGDTSWVKYAERWNINQVLYLPLDPADLLQFVRSRLGNCTSLHQMQESFTGIPHIYLEELDNNRFFLAASPSMVKIYRDIRVLAEVDVPVLILGESGVGKEIVALMVHKYHARREKPFLNINCAALPFELLESELFGYEAGAFTGAAKAKIGMFEMAHNGTLLLDEIGEMSLHMQAKLLHVLNDGTFCRLGARFASRVDVRVLAATNVNMQTAIQMKTFREDLYYRLNTFTINIPPLRERREEIPLLIAQLILRENQRRGQSFAFSPRLMEAAVEYYWPGNVRELRNFVTRTLILNDEEAAYSDLRSKIALHPRPAAQPFPPPGATPELPAARDMKCVLELMKKEVEVRMLQEALLASGWNRRKAARKLNISYRSLLYKIQQHGIRV